MHRFLLSLALLGPARAAGSPQESAVPDTSFPTSTALAEGLDPAALDALDDLVRSLADEDEVVGAELLVLKNGRAVLHEAYGWADREAERPMETGRLFCVRSMTKPVIAAAVGILIEEGMLGLDDRVGQYLESFDVEGTREITVEHLLTHTSGLPMSLILGKDLAELYEAGGIRAVADLGGGLPLEFAPGTDFEYSDQGTDTLTALVEIVSGVPADEFVRTRVLEPLGMWNSTCVLAKDHPLRERALPKYAGAKDAWACFWRPDGEPLFPFFLGSQGLYSTLEDYARFMQLWADRGRAGRERLLGSFFVRRALTPGPHPPASPTGLPETSASYGYLMQLWPAEAPADGGKPELVAFGHGGSDGTHAWAFPEQDAMALYFTQSRNNTTGLRVEEALGRLFLGAPFDPNLAAPPFEDYLGYYWEGEGDLYRAIVRDGKDLALEIMGKGVVPLTYAGDDRWKFRPNPSVVLAFQRDESGEVTGYAIGDHQETRFQPSEDLPSADEVAALVAATHRIDRLESLGPVRIRSRLSMEKIGVEGSITSLLAWPDRFRVETRAAQNFEHVVHDGEVVRTSSSMQPVSTLEGLRAESVTLASPFVRFGDWRAWFPRLEVIQELEDPDGGEVFLVRTGDTSAPAKTMYVHWGSGRVIREDSLIFADGMGRIGQRVRFEDFRDVSGMLLPHRTETDLPNPMIGRIETSVLEIELGVELAEDAFELRE